MSTLEQRLLTAYTFEPVTLKTGADAELIQVKTGDSGPFRLVERNGEFILSVGGRERVYLPLKFYQVKRCQTRDEALTFIINRHNKACAYMTHWRKI